MAATLVQLFSICAGSLVTLMLYGLIILLRNLPRIVKAIQQILKGTMDVSVLGYKTILAELFPVLTQHTLYRILLTTALSFILCGLLTYMIAGELLLWPFVIALIHGVITGVLWETTTNRDHLYLGRNL